MCHILETRATNMVSALISTSGTPPGGCLIKINRSRWHPWKHAFVMSPDLTVRRSHETHERIMLNPSMSKVGESVLTPVVSLQISTADQSTFEQRSNMRTTFASFMLVFVDVDTLKWNRFVSLNQQLFQFGSRYWIYSVKMFPLVPFNFAGFRQT